ncbi:MAG: archease, partial [Thermoplasmata archaeon]|nr:archease [Thermoplasmata archaeon]
LLPQEEWFIGRTLHVSALGTPPTSALARVGGERFDSRRHSSRAEVKAVTMHRLVFDPVRGRARVILDI